ncbi:uncharacterized protein METZ01_LOCUS289843, partial [marine metagenome]
VSHGSDPVAVHRPEGATGIFLANGTRAPVPVTENRQVLSLKVFSESSAIGKCHSM